ncbi:hypothetical protein GIY56_02565 [Paracoccus sp. YIM 132242]|uniref:Uncharacterized protein n=1 Tax=Paracoccus lichenicola TaxID=2665644 RepID=A0A6L6HJ05_9RHOB|nr:hypothetical protein [Paracoccus lichenicola]MTD99166.1 hypothetical protein [Paracoccus lichenicola]
MRMIDFSNWNSILSTVIGIALFALIGIGIRVLVMFTVQQRRERMNRQINERLRVLIAAYKVLGGSFTGDLAVDPTHLRDLRQRAAEGAEPSEGSDRRRRIRDAVEAALSDILLLGTETHVRLAERAARDLVEGRPVHTGELVRSLRDFIRQALDLDPVPANLAIPPQGPTRPAPGGGKGRDEARSRSGGGGGGGGEGGGGGMGMGMGMGRAADEPASGSGPAS